MDTRVVIDHLGTTGALGSRRATVCREPRSGGRTAEQVPGPPLAAAPERVTAREAVWRLEAHVTDLRRQLEDRTREAAQLHTLLAQAHQLALPAPAFSSSATENGQAEAAPEPQQSTPPPEQGERRWWQRLLWG
jgi:hypothetical protein